MNKKIDKIKTSALSRSLSVAKMALKGGASLAAHSMSTILSDEQTKNEKWANFLNSQAQSLTSELGELKGSLMKAGQLLSMYGEHFLPPEATKALKGLQSQSPPLKWEAIESLLKQYLSEEQLAKLDIEKEAIASASMGQVHRARIRSTQETVAIKIQYPGVEESIESDLKNLKSALKVLKFLPAGLQSDHVFDEIREMLLRETNYELEAEITEYFADKLKDDNRFVVPKVYREFSTRKTLVTSFERGISADDSLVTALSQERRNRLALNFLDLYFKELFVWGRVQTDPHLGNYRIRLSQAGEDQIVLFDFGAVRDFADSFLKPYHEMLRCALRNDREGLAACARELKLLHESESANPEIEKLFVDFCMQTVEPFLDATDSRKTSAMNAQGEYDWKNTDLPQRLSSILWQMIRKFELQSPPREVIFLDRKTGGVFIFMGVLRAKLRSRDLILKYLGALR